MVTLNNNLTRRPRLCKKVMDILNFYLDNPIFVIVEFTKTAVGYFPAVRNAISTLKVDAKKRIKVRATNKFFSKGIARGIYKFISSRLSPDNLG